MKAKKTKTPKAAIITPRGSLARQLGTTTAELAALTRHHNDLNQEVTVHDKMIGDLLHQVRALNGRANTADKRLDDTDVPVRLLHKTVADLIIRADQQDHRFDALGKQADTQLAISEAATRTFNTITAQLARHERELEQLKSPPDQTPAEPKPVAEPQHMELVRLQGTWTLRRYLRHHGVYPVHSVIELPEDMTYDTAKQVMRLFNSGGSPPDQKVDAPEPKPQNIWAVSRNGNPYVLRRYGHRECREITLPPEVGYSLAHLICNLLNNYKG